MSAEKITVDEEYLVRVLAVVGAAQTLTRHRRTEVSPRFVELDLTVLDKEVDALRQWSVDAIDQGGQEAEVQP